VGVTDAALLHAYHFPPNAQGVLRRSLLLSVSLELP